MSEPEIMGDAQPETGAAGLLPFERWADLSARLLNLGVEERLTILDEHDVDPTGWAEAEEHYALSLAREVAEGRMDRAESYAGKCVAELERRKAPVKSPAPQPAEATAPRPANEAQHGAPLDAPPPDVPTFLHEQVSGAAPSSPAQLGATLDPFALPTALRGGALPFKAGTAPSSVATPTDPASRSPSSDAGETVPLGSTVPMVATLPFGGGEVRARAPQFPRMSLNTYAAFYADLATLPDIAEVYRKYGIRSGGERVALDEDWRARFDKNPDLRAEWQALVAQRRQGHGGA